MVVVCVGESVGGWVGIIWGGGGGGGGRLYGCFVVIEVFAYMFALYATLLVSSL